MIVNFILKNGIAEINPYLQPDENKSWNMITKQVILTFEPISKGGIFEVICSFISRSDGNPYRILFFVYLDTNSTHITYTPTLPIEYKFRLHSSYASDVILRSTETQQHVKILKGAFSFDISENARLQ